MDAFELLSAVADISGCMAPHTHVSVTNTKSYWNLHQHGYGQFWVSFCKLMSTGERYAICEHVVDVMPVIIDLSLSFGELYSDAYGEEFLHSLVYIYQNALRQVLQVDDKELTAFVLEDKDALSDADDPAKLRIRVQFQLCKTAMSFQVSDIRPKIIQGLRSMNIMSKLPQMPNGDLDDILTIPQEYVSMYGCSNKPGLPNMELTHIYGVMAEDDDVPVVEYNVQDVLSLTEHEHCRKGLVNQSLFAENDDYEFWLPMLLSIHYCGKITLPKSQPQSNNGLAPKDVRLPTSDDELSLAQCLLPMLSPKRYEEESTFLEIGKALYSATHGDPSGLRVWKQHTEQALKGSDSSKSRMAMCDEKYMDLYIHRHTVKTIAWYAKEDNYPAYKAWHDAWVIEALDKAVAGKQQIEDRIAELIYRMFWLNYAFADVDKGRWYEYREHRWKDINNGIPLRTKIKNNVIPFLNKRRIDISLEASKSSDDELRENQNAKTKKIEALIDKLGRTRYKSTMMTELRENFHNEDITELLNADYKLTPVFNGVIEVCGAEAFFRKGKPEDYVSMENRVIYTDMGWGHPKVKEAIDFINKLFVDEKLVHHFRKFQASVLIGRNVDKIFAIFSGESGNNAKSTLIKVFKAWLGPMCTVSNVGTLSTFGFNSSGPTPEKARLFGVRLNFINEPDPQEKLKAGKIKDETGDDLTYNRMLHDNGCEKIQTHRTVVVCNIIPEIPNRDKATDERTQIFPFDSQWVDNPPETEEEQMKERKFKKDPFFERKIQSMSSAFLWLAVHDWSTYYREGMSNKPELVLKANRKYWEDTNIYSQFTLDCTAKPMNDKGEVDIKATLQTVDVLDTFDTWRKKWHPKHEVERRTIMLNLSKLWGEPHLNVWHGLRLTGTLKGRS